MRAAPFLGEGSQLVVITHLDITVQHEAQRRNREQATDLTVRAADLEAAAGIRAGVRATGRWEGRFDVIRKDGSSFPALVSNVAIYDADGSQAGVVGAAVDISASVEADRQLREAREQAEAARSREELMRDEIEQKHRLESVGQLAGGIAHEFNNALGVILNYAQFVSDDVSVDSRAHEDVEQIRLAAERAARLTHEPLILSRRDAVAAELLRPNGLIAGPEDRSRAPGRLSTPGWRSASTSG